MNKKELIEKYKTKGEARKEFPVVAISDVLKDLRELDEPQKVKVPQFVADWIEYCKNTNVTMTRALLVGEVDFYNYANQKDFSRLKEFLETESNQETFVLAWIYSYEVEKEKRYIVSLKNGQPLVKSQSGSTLYFSQDITAGSYKVTRKRLEDDGFGWVFDCEGVEVEEETE